MKFNLEKQISTTQWQVISKLQETPEALSKYIFLQYNHYVELYVNRKFPSLTDLDVHKISSAVFQAFDKKKYKLIQNLNNPEGKKGRFRALIKTITDRKIIDFFKRNITLVCLDMETQSHSCRYEKYQEYYIDCKIAIEQLKKEKTLLYEAFELRYVKGYSVIETSQKLGITRTAVTTRTLNCKKWFYETYPESAETLLRVIKNSSWEYG